MEDNPPAKLPGEYVGEGTEIIGNPDEYSREASLIFIKGKFSSLGFPVENLVPLPDSNRPQLRVKKYRRLRGTEIAHAIKNDIADDLARAELHSIIKACQEAKPRERGTEDAVRKVLNGNFSEFWSFQERRKRAAARAIIQTACELERPPTEDEVIDRMKRLLDEEGQRLTVDGSTKNLQKFLRKIGFSWLERRPRGHHKG